MNDLKCVYCGAKDGPFHRDHVVPRSRGGPDHPSNIVMACTKCNMTKGNRLPSEWLGIGNGPALAREIEAQVCAIVEVLARGKRGFTAAMMSAELLCDACGSDLASAYRKDVSVGRLSWWVDRSLVVQEMWVMCRPECWGWLSKRCRELDLLAADRHLGMFAGEYALPQMWRLLRDYETWSDQANQKLVTVFYVIQNLPTDASARSQMAKLF